MQQCSPHEELGRGQTERSDAADWTVGLEKQLHPRCPRRGALRGHPRPLHQQEENHCPELPGPGAAPGGPAAPAVLQAAGTLGRCGHGGSARRSHKPRLRACQSPRVASASASSPP